MIKKYIQYLKDNPKGYWFKAKLYGWGWAPVKWQGWVIILIYTIAIILFAYTINENSSKREIIFNLILPFVLLTVALTWICHKKGEKPHWQWGLPKSDKLKKD